MPFYVPVCMPICIGNMGKLPKKQFTSLFLVFKITLRLTFGKAWSKEPPTAVGLRPKGKRNKDKIAPFRFAPLRNFPKSLTPPFLCRLFPLYKNP